MSARKPKWLHGGATHAESAELCICPSIEILNGDAKRCRNYGLWLNRAGVYAPIKVSIRLP